MPSNHEYRLQGIFSRLCETTAHSLDSATVHELGRYNHFRATYVLGVYK
jgi:hypothetical protein